MMPERVPTKTAAFAEHAETLKISAISACSAVLVLVCLLTFSVSDAVGQTQRRPTDEALKARVQAALASAADVPGRDIIVDVKSGVVSLTGRVPSDSMRGGAYPQAFLQQSMGAIVRAVPGVKDVRFSVQIEPLRPAAPQGRGANPGAR